MLRLLCLVACFLCVNDVLADNKYIRVVGEGTTIEQAKETAFRTAVQQRAGAIELSERQANNGNLDKDNISLFSNYYCYYSYQTYVNIFFYLISLLLL